MKLFAKVAVVAAVVTSSLSFAATDRHVHGVITSVDPVTLTISSANRAVTGKIDPSRTKVTKNGKPARLQDLVVTAHAKAELCLDDVWLSVDTH